MLYLPNDYIKRQSGQALLLILLVMSLVLTLVLSSVSRSVTDVDISSYEDSSIRAFDAAQAGIEKTMIVGSDQSDTDIGNSASFVSRMTTVSEVSQNYKYPLELLSGESATIFFVSHTVNSNGDYVMSCDSGCVIPNFFTVCWGEEGTPADANAPALYLEFYYDLSKNWLTGNFSNVSVATSSADPYSTRRLTNKFFDLGVVPGAYPCGRVPNEFAKRFSWRNIDYYNYWDLNYPNESGELLFVKITMLYNTAISHPIWVNSTGNLPIQGSAIESVGSYGDVSRRLLLHRGYPEFPSEFGNAIYSGNTIAK